MATITFQQAEQYWIQACQNLNQQGLVSLAPVMAEVAQLESGLNPNATVTESNGSGGQQTSNGLWQISTGTLQQPNNWQDPLQNAEYAVEKYVNQGPTTAWPNTYPQAVTNLQNAGANIYSPSASSIQNDISQATASGQQAIQAYNNSSEWPPQIQLAVVVILVLLLGSVLYGNFRRG